MFILSDSLRWYLNRVKSESTSTINNNLGTNEAIPESISLTLAKRMSKSVPARNIQLKIPKKILSLMITLLESIDFARAG